MFFAIFVLFQNLLITAFQAIAFYKCFTAFWTKNLLSSASPLLKLFFCYLTMVSFTALIYTFYIFLFWRPSETLYNGITLYLIGLFPWILLISNPIFEFALCIERCCLVVFPCTYFYQQKRLMACAVFIITILILSFNLWLNGFIWLPTNGITECRYFSCVITSIPARYINAYKIVISVLEVGAALILISLIKFRTISLSQKRKKKNFVILIIVFSTVIFEFLPNIADTIYFHHTEKYLINLIGPYRTTLSSFNICKSAVLYTYVLNKPKNAINVVKVFATSSSK